METKKAMEAGLFTGRQTQILESLVADGPATVDDFIKRLGVSRGGIRHALLLLEKQGAVRKRKFKTDRIRVKFYINKEVDPERVEREQLERCRKDRHRLAKARGDERPTRDELEAAVREIQLAKQYFLRQGLMMKIAKWMGSGART
jgi:predicted transcriptional regulator